MTEASHTTETRSLRRPTKPEKWLATEATDAEARQHYSMMLDYWIALACFYEQLAIHAGNSGDPQQMKAALSEIALGATERL